MPLITIKVFESELTKDQAAEMIQDITEAVIPYVGEVLRSNTWVLVEEVKSGSWGGWRESPWTSRPPPDPRKRTARSAAIFAPATSTNALRSKVMAALGSVPQTAAFIYRMRQRAAANA